MDYYFCFVFGPNAKKLSKAADTFPADLGIEIGIAIVIFDDSFHLRDDQEVDLL